MANRPSQNEFRKRVPIRLRYASARQVRPSCGGAPRPPSAWRLSGESRHLNSRYSLRRSAETPLRQDFGAPRPPASHAAFRFARQDRFQVVMLDFPRHLPLALKSNCLEFPNSCPRWQFTFRINDRPHFSYSQSFLTLVTSSFSLSITVMVLSTLAKSSLM